VRGNHDRVCCGLASALGFNPIARTAATWTQTEMTEANREWLAAAPKGPLHPEGMPGIALAHGSPLNEDQYILTMRDAWAPLQQSGINITFIGHTHLQGGFTAQGEISEGYRPGYRTVGQPESSDWPLHRELRFLINPGSVGQPRDGDWRAGFAVFDSDAWIVSFYRIPYNLRVAQEKILAANLPQRLATRLATGR